MNQSTRPSYLIERLLALLLLLTTLSVMLGQQELRVFTVGAARENANHIGSTEISVRGHLWLGKEGSMLYDSGYKAILRLQYTDEFNAKHRFHELLNEARKSNIATIRGRLHLGADRQLILIADDIEFANTPH